MRSEGKQRHASERWRCPQCGQWHREGAACALTRKPLTKEEILKRIEASTVRAGADDCWQWTGKFNKGGYAVSGTGYVARQLLGLEDGDGLEARHTCDNPPCVNPAHLVRGTSHDNHRDMVERNRSPRGERHWNWKGGISRNYRNRSNRMKPKGE